MTWMTVGGFQILIFNIFKNICFEFQVIVVFHVGGFGPIFDFSCVCCRKQSAAGVGVSYISLTHQGTEQRL